MNRLIGQTNLAEQDLAEIGEGLAAPGRRDTDPQLLKAAAKQDRMGLLSETVRAAFITGSSGLLQIESRISDRLNAETSELSEISQYLFHQGGKRIRPLLCVLSARLFGMVNPSPQLVDAAAGIEMIHMGTLLHDDIIDRSPTRRNMPSAYRKYGLAPTLLAGDYLLTKAFGLCAKLDDFVVTATEQACIALTEGELLEGHLTVGAPQSIERYMDIVEKKTAALFWLASEVGAHLAGATEREVAQMREFGRLAGIAFQIVDDILDVVAEEDLLGKPAGTDLRQRTPSLVNILWLAGGDPQAKEFFADDGFTAGDPAEIADKEDAAAWERKCRSALEALKRSDVVDRTRAVARETAAKAGKALMDIDNSRIDRDTRGQLLALLEYTLERCL